MTCHCGQPMGEDREFAVQMATYRLPQRRAVCPMGHSLITGAPEPIRTPAQQTRAVFLIRPCRGCHKPLGWARNAYTRKHADCRPNDRARKR